MNIKIAVAYHKECEYVEDDVFLPIQVGTYRNKQDLGIQKDSDGENISKYNPYCSEMTATYWLWKNVRDADYYGLCHYRRFFSFDGCKTIDKAKQYLIYYASKALSPFIVNSRYTFSHSTGKLMTTEEFKSSLLQLEEKIAATIINDHTELICLKKTSLSTSTCMMKLQHCIGILNYNKLIEMINEIDPEFCSYFLITMKRNYYFPYNMTIMSKKHFNAYCKVIFTVLDRYHAFINDGMNEDAINNTALRTSGYIAEYLTSSYVSYLIDKGTRVKEVYCTSIETENAGLSLGIENLYSKRIKSFLKSDILSNKCGGVVEYVIIFDSLSGLLWHHHCKRVMVAA